MPHTTTTPVQRAEQLGATIGSKLLADLKGANDQAHAATILADAMLCLLELRQPEQVAPGFAAVLLPVIEEGLGLGLPSLVEGNQS